MPEAPVQSPSAADPFAHPAAQFVHLHLHSEYSLLDGGNQIDKLVDRVAELGMKACAVTDHGNIFGAVAFYEAAKAKGIKPILGVEAYVTPPGKPRTDRTYSGGGEGGYHTVLLAMNLTGWRNLMVLCSEAFLTGFYYKPRIDRELLAKHSEGVIAINGHLGSEIGDHLLAFERSGDKKYWELAKESASWHKKAFGIRHSAFENGTNGESRMPNALPRFYIELQHHIPEQNSINKHLIKLARELDVPLVCDNDAHFLREEDHDSHDTLICISTGKGKRDENRMRYPREIFVKDAAQMRELFDNDEYNNAEYGQAGREALANTVAIARACDVTLPVGANHAPLVRVVLPPEGKLPKHTDPQFAGDLTAWYKAYCGSFSLLPFRNDDGSDVTDAQRVQAKADCDTALRMLAEGGFIWRYGNHPREPNAGTDATLLKEHTDKVARLDRELGILANKNISAYFLIVWDFVNWGRNNGVPALARGSGVGTMVGYVLGLSNACPVRYGLLFERFTDPDRSEYPDIDIDLCQDGRQRVIEYVRQKYGHVAQIITFGTMKAKAAIRDVGRVLELPIPEVDRICKLVPEGLDVTIDKALEDEPELRGMMGRDDRIRELIEQARALEGHTRHAGVHAAGVIVATRPLNEVVPLYKQSGEDATITQWDGPTCEKMGLLKMDFLGLRTISVVERAKQLIRATMSEEEVWAAVGRAAEYKEWQSGKVAKWQSEESSDGKDQDVSGHARVAEGNGTREARVSSDSGNAEGRGLRAHESDASGGDIDSHEHRGGLRTAHKAEVHSRAENRSGLAERADNGVRAGGVDADDPQQSGASVASRRRGSSSERAHSQPRSQGSEIVDAPKASTSPLRHSATSPLSFSHPLDLDRLSFSDQRVFEIFKRGETTGVFQFESGGMRRLLVEMKPDRLEDLIAANALFRPGPMDLIPDYNRRKHGTEDVPKVHEIVDKYTLETYGVMVYQEQVMQIVHGLGGIKLRDAYSLIKNISKKKHDKIEKERPKFIEGAVKQGLTKEGANDLFELILKFAGYGFNKSHSTGYAIVAYQTAYLKTYFPHQYMAAFLTYESQASKVSDWIPYLEDCRRTRVIDPISGTTKHVGVEVKPPDINLSQADFTVVRQTSSSPSAQCPVPSASPPHIRFGLRGIKGGGDKAISAIIAERDKGGPFTSLHDFCERVPQGSINKATIEALIKCSAFDSVHGKENRAAMVASIESAVNAGAKLAEDKAAGQGGLFLGAPATPKASSKSTASTAANASPMLLNKATPWSETDALAKEKEVLGFYVSSHPLERWKPWSSAFANANTARLKQMKQDDRVVLPAMISSVRAIVVRQGRSAGQKMAILTVEDHAGSADCVLFTDNFAKYGHLAEAEKVVFVLGRLDLSRGDPQVIAERLVPIEGMPFDSGKVRVFVDEVKLNGGATAALSRVAQLFKDSMNAPMVAPAGPPATKPSAEALAEAAALRMPVEVIIGTETDVVAVACDPKLRIPLEPQLVTQVQRELGDGMLRVVGAFTLEKDKPKPWEKGKKKPRQDDDEV